MLRQRSRPGGLWPPDVICHSQTPPLQEPPGADVTAEKLDPEDVHRIMDRCFELITAEVHRFEGTVNQ